MPRNKNNKPEETSSKKVIIKYAAILASAALGCFVIVRISRPILLSLAHYIISLEKGGDGNYQAMEVAVETEEVKSVVMPKYINTIGELKADKSVVIHSEINGKIDSISFTEGTTVTKDALLIKFDDKQAQAELRLRRAKLKMAELEYARYQKMRESGAGSEKEMDKAAAEFNMATSEVEAAEAQLQKTEIRAPFDGTIGLIDVGVGAYVQPNQDLVTLVDQNSIKVKFGVSGKYVNDVGVGQTVELRVESCKNRVFNGIVEAVDSHVDSSTNNISLRAAVSNEDGTLKAGLFADVMLVIGEQGEVITVDEAAVERMGEQEFVWVVDRKQARRIGILTGARYRGRIEVVAGLKPGQMVVTAGQLRLFEGAWVRSISAESGGVDSDGAIVNGLMNEVM
ncbi:MAG: efflux RND transporter periplasmic adaptor subunit [Holosporales bacterium]|jgi:membrane fusion protein (multidrug efflux system)|nr:efflux RND transporter periplasmic adaptor subunit [Holosporales bacterium]